MYFIQYNSRILEKTPLIYYNMKLMKERKSLSDWRMMNYNEARVYLDNVAKYGSVLGLDTMKALLLRLGSPDKDLKFIHISGTNGKGSILAFLSTVLAEAGYRVGRYLSPTLFSYRERIQVNGEYIEKDALARLTTEIREAAERLEKEEGKRPTAFEIETALSFLYFKEKACDLVVLECGLGGRDDATNVIETTILEVFASISLDHLGVLGNTLLEIADCKAAIIKEGTAVVSAPQTEEVRMLLKKRAEEKQASFRMVEEKEIKDVTYGLEKQLLSYGGYRNISIHLSGAYQIINGATALAVLMELNRLGYQISEEAVRKGMDRTSWRGRFTVLSTDPVFIMDGAHNEAAARLLVSSIKEYFTGKKISFIMGVFQDKEYEKLVRITAPYAKRVTCVETPGNPRALPKEELKKVWEKEGVTAVTAETIEEAVEKNMELANQDEVIIAFGSLSYLGEVEKAVEFVRRK